MKAKSAAAPFIAWVLIFTVVPLCLIVYFALTDASGAFTMENIINIKDYFPTLWESILLGAAATLICLIVGYPMGYFISRMSARSQATMTMLIMMPMWMNFLLRTYAWMNILEKNGLINQLLGLIGIGPLEMMNTRGAVVLGMVYNFLPYMILPLYSVMTKIDASTLDAARDLGANGVETFRRVILPLSVPGIISGITMVFVPSVSTFIISQLLGGSKHALIGDIIDLKFLGGAPDYNMGAALSLVLMVLMLICMFVMNRFDDDEGGFDDYMKHFQRLYTAIIFIFLYAPIVVMIVFSFNSTRYRTANFEEFTLKWYEELFKNETIMNSLFLTLAVAVIASAVATIIGTMAAVGMYSMNKRMRAILMTVNNIPMVNPEIVTGVSMLLLFVFVYSSTGLFKPGFMTLLLAHITFCIPYVILSVLPKLRQMNPNIYEAAMDLGCTPSQSFFKVVLPEIVPGIVTGAIMAFTLSLDDFVISYFTGGSQAQTLPVTIYSMTKKNVKPTVFALSTLLFAAVFILLLAVNIGQIAGANKKAKKN